MNARQAEKEGYEFTGAYSRNKEEMKEGAKKERKEGYKAIVVYVPSSKYSRGYRGGGYSVYRKDTPKTIERKENERKEKEQKLMADTMAINSYFLSLPKEDIVKLFIDEKGDKLFSWARENKII